MSVVRSVIAAAAAAAVVAWAWTSRDDPRGIGGEFAPRISLVRLAEFEGVDPLAHAAAVAHARDFSRVYQDSFAGDTDARRQARMLHRARRRCAAEMHGLRMCLPNDLNAERRLLHCIEETDAVMAAALAELADRRPEACVMSPPGPEVRGAEDVWV